MSQEQPKPVGDGPAILPKVLVDLNTRAAKGIVQYGTPLRAHNGRDALADAYDEALDLVMYLRQALYERDGK